MCEPKAEVFNNGDHKQTRKMTGRRRKKIHAKELNTQERKALHVREPKLDAHVILISN